MKLVLICAGGLSTSWIVRKMKDYAREHNLDLDVQACGLADYEDPASGADLVLLGPQIGYYQKEISQRLNRPITVIDSADYALANIETILKKAAETFPGDR